MSNMFEAKFQSFKLNIFQIHEQIRKSFKSIHSCNSIIYTTIMRGGGGSREFIRHKKYAE